MQMNPESRMERIIQAVDDWSKAGPEIAEAVVDGLAGDLNPRVNSTQVVIEGHTSDGRLLRYTVRLNTAGNILEAVDGTGMVWASAVTIEGLTQQIYGLRVAPQ